MTIGFPNSTNPFSGREWSSYWRQEWIDILESLWWEVEISEICNDIEISDKWDHIAFMYHWLMLWYIDYMIDDYAASIEFVWNINMSQKDAELYWVIDKGLTSLEDEHIRIEWLWEYMLKTFVDFLNLEFNTIEVITAEIDNPRIIELFTKMKSEKVVSWCSEDVWTDENWFSRKYLDVTLNS